MKSLVKIIFISIILIFVSLFYARNVDAKYVIEQSYEIINIKKADTELPYINERNYDVNYEIFGNDVTIDYSDNIKVEYAKYWYNSTTNEFDENGTDFDSGTTFDLSGWYKVEVSDVYGNITTYIFCIDKEFNELEISCLSIDDDGGTLEINAVDVLTGIQKIEIYINGEFYDDFTYNEWFINSKTEEIFVNIDNLPFYEEAYVVATDFYGNVKTSDTIIPNKNRIYDLEDLEKFRTMVNTGISDFTGETIYLLNDLDLESLCSETIGSWTPIGKSNKSFNGIFDGKNYTISNLYINTSSSYCGLFGYISGTIQNLNLTGTIVEAGESVGAFVGYLYGGMVKNCTNEVSINTTSKCAGGIVGSSHSSEVLYCVNLVSISGTWHVGGIVGDNRWGTLSYCYNTGNVTGTDQYIGGVVGYTNRDVKFCSNSGNVKGYECVAGIAGAAWEGDQIVVEISYVYNTGDIEMISKANSLNGGIVGGTYYDCYGDSETVFNITRYGYNIGNVTSNTGEVNQIGRKYMECTDMYYISGRSNYSGVGIAKDESLFKADVSNTSSVLYLLSLNNTGIWTIDSNYNSRICNFIMAIKLKICIARVLAL